MRVYQYKIWDKKIAVDVESGNFFEVDNCASEAITLMQEHSKDGVSASLSKKYGSACANRTMRNLAALRQNKMLFAKKNVNDSLPKRKITDLTLNIVNKCNLSCRYCWNSRGAYGKLSYDGKLMNSPVAFKAIDLLLKESGGTKDLVVDFYGGEPLLNYGLIREVIGYCRNIQKRRKINFRFLLATNGTLLSGEKGEFLIDNGVDIAVSLDGSRRIQDMQRPFADGKGTFSTIMENLHCLGSDYRSRIVGRATFTPYSSRVVDTFKFLRSLGFDRIEVCESEKAGYGLESRNEFFFNGQAGLQKLKLLYNKLALFYTDQILEGNLTYENTYFNRFFKQLSRLYHIQSIVGSCSAGFSLISVDIDGSIYPCTAFVGMPKFRIGTVGAGIDKNKLDNFTGIKISANYTCNNCWAKRLCRGCGSCYNLNYFSNKSLGKPDPYYCELFRYKTKLMMAMLAKIAEKDSRLLDKVFIPEYYATRGRKNKIKK